MLKTRIIPCLLLRDGGLVKTEKFKQSKYIGDPINAVRIYNEKEVDELIFLDIDASKHNKEPNLSIINDLATECFMPFAYGGGVKTIRQIQQILHSGVEKVVINQTALADIDFIRQASKYFGSSTIIVAMDVKKDFWGHYKVYDHVKSKVTPHDPLEYAQRIADGGAGELFINNVDRDGTYTGLDAQLINQINKVISIPIIACGGVSGLDDIRSIVSKTGVSAIAAGSIFVYQGPHRAVLISYPTSAQLQEIFS